MTKQISDKLIYNDEIYQLEDEILEFFLEENGFKSEHSGSFSANWRGYVAEFEIKNLEIHLNTKDNEFFESIIKKLGTSKIYYLNKLIILYSKLKSADSWIKSLNEYETYQILEFVDGNLMDFKILNNDEFKLFKRNQFIKYIETKDYNIEKQKRIQRIDSENEILRKEKNKGPNWHKFKFKETEFLDEVEKYIFNYTKRFY